MGATGLVCWHNLISNLLTSGISITSASVTIPVSEMSDFFFSVPPWQMRWYCCGQCPLTLFAVLSCLLRRKATLQNSNPGRVNESQCIWQPILPTVSVSDVWLLKSPKHTAWLLDLLASLTLLEKSFFRCRSLRDLFSVESLAVIMGRLQPGVDRQATFTLYLLDVWVSVAESQHLWIEVYWPRTDTKCLLWSDFKSISLK